MSKTDLSLIPMLPVTALRDHLAEYLQEVGRRGKPVLITRMGYPVAGLVGVTEARAIWAVAQQGEAYVEWQAMRRMDKDRDLRMALRQEREADDRRAYEQSLRQRR
jgi:prevent-host-death family protein